MHTVSIKKEYKILGFHSENYGKNRKNSLHDCIFYNQKYKIFVKQHVKLSFDKCKSQSDPLMFLLLLKKMKQ